MHIAMDSPTLNSLESLRDSDNKASHFSQGIWALRLNSIKNLIDGFSLFEFLQESILEREMSVRRILVQSLGNQEADTKFSMCSFMLLHRK